MAKGFVKFVCKVEGKEPSVSLKKKINLSEEYQRWPGEIDDCGAFRILIQDVLDVGVDGPLDCSLLDAAFTWSTHPLEGVFSECYSDEVVSETLYEYCLWADQNLDSMPLEMDSWETYSEPEESVW